ncbi:MAG: hypothetical protein JO022_10730, partial [Acidobacteriaceae bacterium]|nr:hypothetical protein [Acidobacteriaceae bacterium]
MRRSSVIGPMLLILIGLAFLVHNVLPDIPVVDMLGRFWPFVLIAWGFLRLVEILYWASAGKPLPRAGISGGEWVLAIFLCMFGSAVYTARHHVNWLPNGRTLRGMVINMGESYDYNVGPISRSAGKSPRVVIESFRGNARIVGSDENTVVASGRKTVRAFQQNEADQANNSTPLEVLNQSDQIIVRTNQARVDDNLRVTSDLEITVPRGATVEAHGKYGDFDVRDVTGSVDITSDNAGVRLDNIGGDVRVETHKSDVIRATGVKGGVELKGRGQDVELQNVAGKVTVSGDFLGQVEFKNLAQPVHWDGAHANLEFEKLAGQLHMGPGELS